MMMKTFLNRVIEAALIVVFTFFGAGFLLYGAFSGSIMWAIIGIFLLTLAGVIKIRGL